MPVSQYIRMIIIIEHRRYQQTLMYGRYSESLGDYAREEAERQRVSEKGFESIH